MNQFETRTQKLYDAQPRNGEYVLYLMQSSQRIEYNHALFHAIEQANKLNNPLKVAFGLVEYPEANQRHYQFMIQGLSIVQEKLEQMGAGIAFTTKDPSKLCINLSENASLLVLDRGYLKVNKKWYDMVSRNVKCPVIQVESNVVIPVEEASKKEEYSAATFRRKIVDNIKPHLIGFKIPELKKSYRGESVYLNQASLKQLEIENVPPSNFYKGGYEEAQKLLTSFIDSKIESYHINKNDPSLDSVSHLSPYLHFGQISPIEIALLARENSGEGIDAFLEELIIRRELAINFVYYNPNYDNITCLPRWCLETLNEHKKDPRVYKYTKEEFENSETGDEYWNAAQTQMTKTGKMHGYMRMYWGKKILEWTNSPDEAYKIVLYLNNKYEIDGRDPNGYAGVAWCFGKHDRPWKERKIYGKIRYMNDKGLERKFNISSYSKKWLRE